jgi:DNA-binding GntR family transcriptional regulator
MPPTPPAISSQRVTQSGTQTVAETLAEQLRSRIVDGVYVGGQRLIEADILEEFDVGRSAVREALKHLEATGLVEIRRQRGASVVRLTRDRLVQLFEIRERLEGLAAYLAAQVAHRSENLSWLENQRQIWLDDNLVRNERDHMVKNVELHDGIVQMSANQYLTDSLSRLQIPAYRQRFVKVINDETRRKSSAEHVEIIDAIYSGDAERAERCMRYHVRETAKLAASVAD